MSVLALLGYVFNATINNISNIPWPLVLIVKETEENHQPVASHRML